MSRRRHPTDWIPKPPVDAEPKPSWPPWRPEPLAGADPTELSYIVVDELAEGTAVLAVSTWPRLDLDKRLRFPISKRARMVRVEADQLAGLLGAKATGGTDATGATAGEERFSPAPSSPGWSLRIGDVFAARAVLGELEPPGSKEESEALHDPERDAFEWLEPPFYDLRREGKEIAKVAVFAAFAPVLEPKERAELESDEQGPPR